MSSIDSWLDPEMLTDFWKQLALAISKEDNLIKNYIAQILNAVDVEAMTENQLREENTFFNVPYSKSIVDDKNIYDRNEFVFNDIDFYGSSSIPFLDIQGSQKVWSISSTLASPAEIRLGTFNITQAPQILTFGFWVYTESSIDISYGIRIASSLGVTELSSTSTTNAGWTKLVYVSPQIYEFTYNITPFIRSGFTLNISKPFLYRDSDSTDYIKSLVWEREETKNIRFKMYARNTIEYYLSIFKSIFELGTYGRYTLSILDGRSYLVKDYKSLHDSIRTSEDLVNQVWLHESTFDFSSTVTSGNINKLDSGLFLDNNLLIDVLQSITTTKHLVLEYGLQTCKDTEEGAFLLPTGYLKYLSTQAEFSKDVTDQMHFGCQFNQAFDININAYSFNNPLRVNRFQKIFSENDIATLEIGYLPVEVSLESFNDNFSGLSEYTSPASPFLIDTPLATIPLSGPQIQNNGEGWINVLYEYVGGYRNKITPEIVGTPTTYTYDLVDSFGFDVKTNSIKATFQVGGVIHTVYENVLDDNIGTLERINTSEVELNLKNTRTNHYSEVIDLSTSSFNYSYPSELSSTYQPLSTKVIYYVEGSRYEAYEQADHTLLGPYLTGNSQVLYSEGVPDSLLLDVGALSITIYSTVEVFFSYTSSEGIDNNSHIVFEYFDSYPKDITQISLNDIDRNVLVSCNFNPIQLKSWAYHLSIGLALKE